MGYKHKEETKKLLSELAKNRTHSEKTKSLIARAVTGENNPFYNKSHSIESKLRMIEANSAYPVYIYNSFKELLVIFPSVRTLAKLIKSNHSTLVNIIKVSCANPTEFEYETCGARTNNIQRRIKFINIPYNISYTHFISHLYLIEG